MKPLAEHGGDRVEQGSDGTLPRGNIASYLVRRLKRDAPEIAQELAQRRHRRATPQQLAADPEVKPLAEHGGDRAEQGSIRTLPRGNIASYLVRRLKREALGNLRGIALEATNEVGGGGSELSISGNNAYIIRFVSAGR